MKRFEQEGLENRFSRHKEMARRVRSWARDRFRLFAEPGYESNTVTCIENTSPMDTSDLLSRLLDKGYRISGGYGPLKGRTFRIAHMGDIGMSDLDQLLATMDEILEDTAS